LDSQNLTPAILIAAAQKAERENNPPEAMAAWRAMSARFPDHPAGFRGEAGALRRLGRLAEAEAVLDQALARFPENLGLAAEQASLACDQRDFPKAAQLWRVIRERYPDNPVGYQGGGLACSLAGLFDEADAVYEAAFGRFPKTLELVRDFAWSAESRGDVAEAAKRWRMVNGLFPDFVDAYLSAGRLLRDAQRFDEADAVYEAAFARFPKTLDMVRDFASSAEGRGDMAEAMARWRSVNSLFPDFAAAYFSIGRLLRRANKLEEAEAIIAEAVKRFPDDPDAMIEYAWLADLHYDWPEALRRWEVVATRRRDRPEGVCGAARALMELGRFDDAKTVLAPALRMFPDDRRVAVISGWLATRRRSVTEAETIWRDVRDRFPDELAGYVGWATVLRDEGRLEDSYAVLREAVDRFPADAHATMDLAQNLRDRRNWQAAISHWEDALRRFPESSRAYYGLGETLIGSGDGERASAILAAGIERFPHDFHLLAAHANAAAALRDWPEALARGQRLIDRFPGNPGSHLVLGRLLRESAQFDRAVEHLHAALNQFPDNLELEIELALTFSAKRNWQKALPLWESLKRRHPGNGAIRGGISDILWQALQDQGAAQAEGDPDVVPFEIPKIVLENYADEPADRVALAELLLRFESLGDTCEFGMVQKRFGAEPLSLLRWTMTTPDNLVAALNNNLDGVGDPEHTIVEITRGEYTTEDRRYQMYAHTFTMATTEPIEEFTVQQLRRIRYLRRKLIQDLRAAKKIFVYKSEEGITDRQVTALYEALRRYAANIILLCVKLEEPGHPSDTLERIDEGLFVGYIDKFSVVDVSVDIWVSLCQRTAAQLSTNDVRPHVDLDRVA
jgi:tetratricopeptide (TPR) repeat protein